MITQIGMHQHSLLRVKACLLGGCVLGWFTELVDQFSDLVLSNKDILGKRLVLDRGHEVLDW